MVILDTNVMSEVTKPERDPGVARWMMLQLRSALAITAITVAEMLDGLERLPLGRRRSQLAATMEESFSDEFATRIVPFDVEAARLCALIMAGRRKRGRPMSIPDAQIAAICASRGATLATRDIGGFEGTGIELVDPWTA